MSQFVRFSPDGKHFVHVGAVEDNIQRRGAWVDKKLISVQMRPQVHHVAFTPDS